MVPLAVDPEALFATGSAVVAAGDGLAANLTVSTAGFAANTGHDVAGTVFGLGYQDAAESLLKAAAAAVNACRCSGALIELGAANYSKAEAASTLGGAAGTLQAPPEPVTVTAPGPPGTLGPGEPPPALWAVVESFVDDVWPDGDVAALHAAAARWRSFGAAAGGMRGALNASKSLMDAQQIPEGGKIDQALSEIGSSMDSFAQQCGKMAATLDDFASQVSEAQNAIRDLLHRLGSLANLTHDVLLIFQGDAIDEIKKIASDINAVLHNLGREARACEQGIKLGMQVVDGLVVKLEKYMRGEFTHFLGDAVGNQVATTFDFFLNANEGALKSAVGMVQGIEDLDPRWFLLDPKGAADTWSGMTKTGLLNHVLNPQEAVEADKQTFRALLHLDDWRADRPGLGLGGNLFDVATLFLPGAGEVGGAAEGAGAAARGAEAADAAGAAGRAGERAAGGLAAARGALAEVARTSGDLTKNLEGVPGNLPKVEPPPVGGRPVGLPAPKPPEAPVESAPRPPDTAPGTPPSPTSPEPPGAAGGGPREAAPARGPHEPASAPAAGSPLASMPAASERVPTPIPQLVEHSPAPVSGNGSLAEATPVAPHSAPAAPSLSTAPHLTPPGLHPPELPAADGGWHGPGDGGPSGGGPHERPPHGGGPHGPGDVSPAGGGPPKRHAHDGTPHGPRDAAADHDGPADGPHHPDPTDGLTSDDQSALAHYTGYGYIDLNDALRSKVLDASQQARIEALNNALDKLPPYEGPVVRGSNLPPEVLSQYQPGEYIIEKGFMSTTTNPAVAQSPAFVGNVEFRIFSCTGRDISALSTFPAEQEILFSSFTRFFVASKKVDPLTGRTIIEMVED